MPRDLFASTSPPQVASPESKTPRPESEEDETAKRDDDYNEFTIHRDERSLSIQMLRDSRAKADDRNELHPYVQTLSLSNLESCVALEDAIFPPNERCTKEKFSYRLTACPELSLGLFSTMTSPPSPTASNPSITDPVPTFSSASPAFSADPSKKQTLIGMVVATKTSSPLVTDTSMEMPDLPSPSRPPHIVARIRDDDKGHHEEGRTICVHSFGILPAYQGRGLGKVLMKSYQQRMEGSGIADRIALLAHEDLVGMYTGMGFSNKGKSDVKFGGGGWTNLVYEFADKGPGS